LEDPFKQYTKRKDGWKYLPFKEDKTLWRDSHTLLKRNQPDEVHPPKTFEWLALILQETDCLQYHQIYRYMALGAGVHYKDAKIYFYRHETMPLPLPYLADEVLVSHLSDAVISAEQVRSVLWYATSTLAKYLISSSFGEEGGRQPDQNDVDKLMKHWGAEANYWSKLETPFMQFVEELPSDLTALDRWKETLQQTAWDALAGAERLAGERAAALKAAMRARGALAGGLNKLFPELRPRKEAVNA
jgi:hypothetical protein